MYLRWPSAKMVSKASEDLPEPERPVMTTSLSRGMSRSMPLRLCSRAPRTRMNFKGSTITGDLGVPGMGLAMVEAAGAAKGETFLTPRGGGREEAEA